MAERIVNRRMGPAGSDNWHAMLDGAESILRDEGYGSLTSRRIAERVGVKQRLVYYYFQTMDEVIVEAFKRMSERELERMRNMASSDHPLRALWDVCINTTDSRLVSEFMALSHRIDELRQEVVHFIEESRRIQTRAIELALTNAGSTAPIDPDGLALLATGVSLAMTRECAIGVHTGHGAIMAMVENFIARVQD